MGGVPRNLTRRDDSAHHSQRRNQRCRGERPSGNVGVGAARRGAAASTVVRFCPDDWPPSYSSGVQARTGNVHLARSAPRDVEGRSRSGARRSGDRHRAPSALGDTEDNSTGGYALETTPEPELLYATSREVHDIVAPLWRDIGAGDRRIVAPGPVIHFGEGEPLFERKIPAVAW